jgi:acyl-CoA reductase-like NAD-dependent aldehyde dehydrogenase/nicotinamidase-related amidase
MKFGLLLIDMQQDYLDRPGIEPPSSEIIANVKRLLDTCRAHAVPVFHVHTLVRADGTDRMPHWQAADIWACVAGSAGALPPTELAPLADEVVIGKRFYSGFEAPDAVARLAEAGLDTLILAGIYTHACVRATALDAYRHGFKVLIVSDAVGSTEPLHAKLTLDYLAGRAATCLRYEELLGRLGSVAERPAADGRVWTQRNPSRWDEVLGEVPLGGAHDAEAAVATAAARGHTSLDQRVSGLERWMVALAACRMRAVELLVREVGKPVTAAHAEVDYALALLGYTISQISLGEADEAGGRAQVRHAPFGPVALITPWNNPLAIPVGKIAPALGYGNTVVWKPALQAPGLSQLVMETLAEAGLGDFVALLTGDSATARHLLVQPALRAVSFTGSIAAGREVAGICAAHGKALQAELGGNNAVIITADTDVERAAAELAPALFSFSGQRCTAPRRLIVERRVKASFEAALVKATLALKIGLPELPETAVGPLISRERQDRMAALVRRAISDGGRLLCGGKSPPGLEQGCWFEPTLIADPNPASAVIREEAFGPVAVVLAADDFTAALEMCNAVLHGLVATLYAENAELQQRFINHAEAGILVLNRPMAPIDPAAPFSGWKASGFGPPEHGRWDLATYARPQAIYR